jgi:uncharacterized protein YyaL (SSP411 family)
MPKNRLERETSPYLRQHDENPVDWYPWGEEALARAATENRPILLSIGYSACHWCHVMAHESFEDPDTADLMNSRYVCVKVDREEMPDLDAIYQQALQLQGEHGGWPLTMFLLPDGTPFFGGTYFPRRDSYGRPSFQRVLRALADAFQHDPDAVRGNALQFREGLVKMAAWGRGEGVLRDDTVDRAAAKLAMRIDRVEGGFEGAPKFPNPSALELVLRSYRRAQRRGDGDAPAIYALVARTLLKMAEGGIYDQLGGGFHRYSTDARWLVPHFEKMLYDNAQLLVLYAEAHQIGRHPTFARVVRETVGYLEREMRSAEGGFYTAQDADSEGVEGKYFVWTPESLAEVLSPDEAALVARCYDVTARGNWHDPHGHGPERASILHVVDTPRDDAEAEVLARAKAKLLAARQKRVAPGTDDKILASSNGLVLGGLAEAGRILGESAFVDGARRTAEFLLAQMRDPTGRLFRTFKHGNAKLPGTLEDHAWVARGLLSLYEASGEARWLEEAHRLTALCLDLFYDDGERAFYMTAAADPGLIQRPVSSHDGAVPSGMSVCVENLVRLGDACGERRWLEVAERVLAAHHDAALANPFGFSQLLCALDLQQEHPVEIVLAGDDVRALARATAEVYLPNRIIVHASSAPRLLEPLVAGKSPVNGGPAAWVCREHTCNAPVTTGDELRFTLEGGPHTA